MTTSLIGQILLNQFRVEDFIASGGMGAVYRVWDLKRNVPLAMKVLHAELSEDPSSFRRFQREARALQRLTHPNIVPFYGLYNSGDFSFLLERYVDGPTLKEVISQRQGQPLAMGETLTIMKVLCAALGYAHANGVVHCDLKPGNVMIDRGGHIYLTDFGVARHAESITTTLAGAGTPAYMAPEQIRGEAVSAATDVYALGVMLFEMMTGRRLFVGNEAGTESAGPTANERIRYAHLYLQPPDPRQFTPHLPGSLVAVLLKALAKESGERYQDAQSLIRDFCMAANIQFEEVQDSLRFTGPLEELFTTEHETNQKLLQGTVTSRTPWQPKWTRGAAVIITGIVGVALLILVFFFIRPSRKVAEPLNIEPVSEGITQTSVDSPSSTSPINTNSGMLITEAPAIPPTLSPPSVEYSPPTSTPIAILNNPQDDAEIVFIPAGEFLMGSDPSNDPYWYGAEGPSHKVRLNDYYIYRTEVTNKMYQECVAQQACPKPEYNYSETRSDYYGNPEFDDYPVIYISWTSAASYCQWAGARLPTEAEWEKAARGTDGRLFPWGNEPPTGMHANFCDRNCSASERDDSQDDGYRDTAPVGSYPAGVNSYGLLDVSGNVWEWTQDWFDQTYYKTSPMENPLGPASGERRVVRGGSLYNPPDGVRTVNRRSERPENAMSTVGFRCVVDEPAIPSPFQPLSPTFEPDTDDEPGGKIVYVCQMFFRKDQNQICIINADGSGQQRLTENDSAEHGYPSLSPDGNSLVFSSNMSGKFEIYEMDLFGSMRKLTEGLGKLYAPEISPDGRLIVFTNTHDGQQTLWLMNRDGSNPHEVYRPSEEDLVDPTWSPDGQYILFAMGTDPENRKLYIIDLSNNHLSLISDHPGIRGRSDWSPDTTTIAIYIRTKPTDNWSREIFFMNSDGTGLRQITDGGQNLAPSFSPGGQWIVFMSYMDNFKDDNGCEIYIMRIDRSDLRRLTNNGYCDYQPRWGP